MKGGMVVLREAGKDDGKKNFVFELMTSGLHTTREALRWLEVNGEEGEHYRTAKMGRRLEVKKQVKSKVLMVDEEKTSKEG